MDDPAAAQSDSLGPMREMQEAASPSKKDAKEAKLRGKGPSAVSSASPLGSSDEPKGLRKSSNVTAESKGLRRSSSVVTDASGVVMAENLRKSSDPRLEAISLSQAHRRSVDNPFFQKTEEDLRMEQLADLMKDDLDNLYTSDELPRVADVVDELVPLNELKLSAKSGTLLDSRAWGWSGAVWKEYRIALLDEGIFIRRVGLIWWEDMQLFAEGRTSRKNDFVSVSANGHMLVLWWTTTEAFKAFMPVFLASFHARPRKKTPARQLKLN